jgi:autotransporter-associated beta strand protein/VCBS repeat-containing protein
VPGISPGSNEVQFLTTGTSGVFRLSFNGVTGTNNLTAAVGLTAATIQAHLRTIPALSPANVNVAGTQATGYTITFVNLQGLKNVPELVPVVISGTPDAFVSTSNDGVIPSGPTVAQVLNHLNTIPALNGNVAVTGTTGGPFNISFTNLLANTNVSRLTHVITGGAPTVTIGTATQGRQASPTAAEVLAHLNTIPELSGNVGVFGANGGPFSVVLGNKLAGQLVESIQTRTEFPAGRTEVQQLAFNGNISGGTFTVTFGGNLVTSPIPYPSPFNANLLAQNIETALESILGGDPTPGPAGHVAVTPIPNTNSYSIAFTGGLANANLPQLSVTSSLSGFGNSATSIVPSTISDGVGNSVQTMSFPGVINGNVRLSFLGTAATETDGTPAALFYSPGPPLGPRPTAAEVLSHLNKIPVLDGNVTVVGRDGGPFHIVFSGGLAGQAVPALVQADPSTPGVFVTITATPPTLAASVINNAAPTQNSSEAQEVAFSGNVTGGSFTLRFGGGDFSSSNLITPAISYSDDPAIMSSNIQKALDDTFGAGNALVTAEAAGMSAVGVASRFVIRFGWRLAGANLPLMFADGAGLVGSGATVVVNPITDGAGNAVHTLTLGGTDGTVTLSHNGVEAQGLPLTFDATPQTAQTEVQRLKINASGVFRLSYDGVDATATLTAASGLTAATVQSNLRTIPALAGVTVSGNQANGYNITFGGTLANTNAAQLAAATVSGNPNPVVTTTTPGRGNEVQKLTVGTSGVFRLSYLGVPATTTINVSSNPNSNAIRDHLRTIPALANVGSVETVVVSGNRATGYYITFTGALANTDVAQLVASVVSGTPDSEVTTFSDGQGAAAFSAPTAEEVLAHLNTIPSLKDNVAVIGRSGGPFKLVFHNNLAGQQVLPLTAAATGGATVETRADTFGAITTNEVQRLTFTPSATGGSITGGTFRLTLGANMATGNIAYSPDPAVLAANIQFELDKLMGTQVPGDAQNGIPAQSLAQGLALFSVTPVSGSEIAITFQGDLANTNMPQFTVTSALVGGAVTASTPYEGAGNAVQLMTLTGSNNQDFILTYNGVAQYNDNDDIRRETGTPEPTSAQLQFLLNQIPALAGNTFVLGHSINGGTGLGPWFVVFNNALAGVGAPLIQGFSDGNNVTTTVTSVPGSMLATEQNKGNPGMSLNGGVLGVGTDNLTIGGLTILEAPHPRSASNIDSQIFAEGAARTLKAVSFAANRNSGEGGHESPLYRLGGRREFSTSGSTVHPLNISTSQFTVTPFPHTNVTGLGFRTDINNGSTTNDPSNLPTRDYNIVVDDPLAHVQLGGVNAIQMINFPALAQDQFPGAFTLTFTNPVTGQSATTASVIPSGSGSSFDAADVASKLNNLTNIQGFGGSVNVTGVSGLPYAFFVEFRGTLAGREIRPMTVTQGGVAVVKTRGGGSLIEDTGASPNQVGTFANLIKSGHGTLSMAGDNSFNGTATVSQGVVRLLSNNALGRANGSAASTLIVNSGAAIHVDANISVQDKNLNLNGSGYIGDQTGSGENKGALRIGDGRTVTWGAGDTQVVLPSGSTTSIGVGANSSLILNATLVNSGSSAANLTKVGGGLLEMRGAQPSTYTGTTTINDGTLRLNKRAGAQVGSAFVVGDNLGAPNSDILEIASPEQLSNSAVQTVQSTGVLRTLTFPDAGTRDEIQQLALSGASGTFQITLDGATTAALPLNINANGGLFAAESEVQILRNEGLQTGNFRLSFHGATTGDLPFNVTAANLQTALSGLSTIGAGNVVVTGNSGGPFTIRFQGELANRNVQPIEVSNSAGGPGFTINASQDAALAVEGGVSTPLVSSLENALNALPTKPANVTFNVSVTPSNSEVQRITVTGPAAGTVSLTFNGASTPPLRKDATLAQVQLALETLSTIGVGNVVVGGVRGNNTATQQARWDITFVGSLASSDVPQIAVTVVNNPSNNTNVTQSTLTEGGAQLFTIRWVDNNTETQLLVNNGVATGSYTLRFDLGGQQTTQSIAFNATAATVQQRLEALSNIGAGNVVVSGNVGGPYTVRFRGTLANVDLPQLVVTNSGPGFQAATSVEGAAKVDRLPLTVNTTEGVTATITTLQNASRVVPNVETIGVFTPNSLILVGGATSAARVEIAAGTTLVLGGSNGDDVQVRARPGLPTGAPGVTISGPGNLSIDVADPLNFSIFISVADLPAEEDLEISAPIVGQFFLLTGIQLFGEVGSRMVLSGDNSYVSPTTITSGTLRVEHANGLGDTASGTIVSSGATLEISGGITIDEDLNISGSGVGDKGALRSVSGDNTIAGFVNLLDQGGIETIGVDAGTLSLTGQVMGNEGLTKVGGGTLELAGTANNTFAGGVAINAGTLRLNMPTFTAIPAQNITVGDGIGGNDADILNIATSDQIGDGANITVLSSGRVIGAAVTETVANLVLGLGVGAAADIDTGTGTLTPTGTITAIGQASANTAAAIAGLVDLGNTVRSVTVNATAALVDLIVSAGVTGTPGLNKLAAGALELSGGSSVTITDATVTEGTLVLNKTSGPVITGSLTVGDGQGGPSADAVRYGSAAGGNQVADTVNVLVRSTGLVDLAAASDTIAGLTLTDGVGAASVVTSTTGTLTLGGDVTVNVNPGTIMASPAAVISAKVNLGGNRTFTVGDSNAPRDLIVSGSVSGTGFSLTKAGAGRMVMQGAGPFDYTGATNVNAGELQLNNATLAGTSAVTVTSAGLSGTGGTPAPVTITGAGSYLSPGLSFNTGAGSTGVLNTGNLTLGPGAELRADVSALPLPPPVPVPTPGRDYDQVNVTGEVVIDPTATLDAQGTVVPDSTGGGTIILINNDGTTNAPGAFGNFAERTTVSINGASFKIFYHGPGLSGDNDVVLVEATNRTYNALAGEDLFEVRYDLASDSVQLLVNGTVKESFALDVIGGWTINGLDGDDRMVVNHGYTGGRVPIGIDFDGGVGADTLEVVGGTFTNATHTLSGSGQPFAGAISYDGATVAYSDVVSVNMAATDDTDASTAAGQPGISTITNLTFVMPTGAGTGTLADDGTAGNNRSVLTSGNASFANVTFSTSPTQPATLSVQGDSNDLLTVNALPEYNRSLTIGSAASPLQSATMTVNPNLAAGANLSIDAGTVQLNADITTGGTQTYGGQVAINADRTLNAGANNITFRSGADITGNFALNANTTGTTTFGGMVNVGSVTTNLGGTTVIDGGSVTTTGNQLYGDNVTLGADTIFDAGATGNIEFQQAVNGAGFILDARSGATTTFTGPVTVGSLTTNAGGTTVLNGTASVTTTGDQSFNDAVTLGTNVVLTAGAGNITMAQTVSGAFNLTTDSTGTTAFQGAVNINQLTAGNAAAGGTTVISGGAITTVVGQTYNDQVTLTGATVLDSGTGNITINQPVTGNSSLTVGNAAAGGSINLNGGTVTTDGDQIYHDNITLGAATTLDAGTAGNINLAGSVGGAFALNANSGATTTFGGAVNVASVTTDAGGATAINGGAVTTTGDQVYGDAVALGADTVLTGNDVTFTDTVNSDATPRSLNVVTSASGTTTFTGPVGGASALASLTTNADGTTAINGGSVITTVSQSYSDNVTLGADTTLDSGAGSISLLGSTVTGTGSLTVGNAAAGGSITIGNTTITTTGAQLHNDAVTLSGNATLDSGAANLSLASTVDGGFALNANSTGTTTLGGAVGGNTALVSFSTNAGGDTIIIGGLVRTTGTQSYGDATNATTDLTIDAGGAVSQTGALTGTGLRLVGAGPFNLDGAINDFDTLAAAASGAISFHDADGINIGTVGPTTGVNAGAGTLTLRTDAGGVTQSAGANIISSGLELLGTGAFTLDGANDLTNFAANVTGSIVLSDISSLTVGTVGGTSGITTAGGHLRINFGSPAPAPAPTLTINQAINTTPGVGGLLLPSPLGAGIVNNSTITTGAGNVVLNNIQVNNVPIAFDDNYAVAEDNPLTIAAPGLLANDVDVDLDPITVSVGSVLQPANGIVSVNADGSFTYTPDLNFAGTDFFRYRITDGTLSNTATVFITVTAVNDPPVAASDGPFTVAEDGTLSVPAPGVLGNDSDVDLPAQPLTTLPVVDAPANGTLTLNPDGSFTYRPNAEYFGPDSFTYRAFDGTSQSNNLATVQISVTAVNDAPVANTDIYVAAEDTALVINAALGVLINDTDVEADILSVELPLVSVPPAAEGTVAMLGSGGFTFTPAPDFNGVTSFSYRANDGQPTNNLSNTAVVFITVQAVNDDPVAVADSYAAPAFAILEDTQFNVSAAQGVLANDADVDGVPPPEAVLVLGPTNASTFTLNLDGSFTYTPTLDFNGVDSFTYRARDAAGAVSSPVVVTLTVGAVNDAPVAADDSGAAYTIAEDNVLNVVAPGIVGNDTDIDLPAQPLSALLVSTVPAAHGTLNLNTDGSFTYTPAGDFFGTTSFTYQVSDGAAVSTNTATVLITITAVNDPPVATDDNYTTFEDEVLTANANSGVLARVTVNDTDADPADTLAAVIVSAPPAAQGTVSLAANGSFTFTPATNFTGPASFVYRATDGIASSTATVNINVGAVNDAPQPVDDSYSIAEDGTLTISAAAGFLSNDIDAEGNALTATQQSFAANGTLTFNADGSFTYRPNANFHGTDSFTYRASDGQSQSPSLGTVVINVTPVNDAPVAVNDNALTVAEDGTLSVTAQSILSNDSDIDNVVPPTVPPTPANAGLTAQLVSPPLSGGTVTLNADGTFVYRPAANFFGTDRFTYIAFDGTLASNTATVLISVTPVNDPPLAVNDNFSVSAGGTIIIAAPGLLLNDVDVDSTTLSATVIQGIPGLSPNIANGGFTYGPAPASGTVSFTYRLSDGSVFSNTATVTITIQPNDPPVATDDGYTVAEDGELTVTASGPLGSGVLSNDIDPENNTLSAVEVTGGGPTNGTLTLNANGTFTYRPNTSFSGVDSFTYQASDGQLTSLNTATVRITVTPTNDLPSAVNDGFSMSEDATLTIAAAGVLANDIDLDNDALTATLFGGQPASGTVALAANGGFTYTPNANFSGVDSFTYRANDGTGDSANLGTVFITVNPINDAPVAADNAYSTDEDVPLTVGALTGVLANDSDADGDDLAAVIVAGPNPLQGSLTLLPNGGFIFTPAPNFPSSDPANNVVSFTYVANDGQAANNVSNTATVRITVNPVNDAPTAADDTYNMTEDGTLTADQASGPLARVTANDNDIDAATTLTAVLVSDPVHGTLTLNADGSFTYTPVANYFGADSFSYRASDGALTSEIAVVSINVAPVNDIPVPTNDPPLANNDAYSIAEDATLTIAARGILLNDIDVDGNTLTVVLPVGAVAPPAAQGTLAVNANGSFTFVPAANFNGVASFTYRVNDGTADSTNSATVFITVTPQPDAPVANPDAYTTAEDTLLTIGAVQGVLNGDTDIDGDILSAVLVSAPAKGTLTLNPNGSFSYLPAGNAFGLDSFTYRASDGTLSSDPATVLITVTATNDAPIAVNDSYTVAEDNVLTRGPAQGVLVNDLDEDGPSRTAILVAQPANGSVILAADGGFIYTPANNFFGTDSFTYRVNDGSLDSLNIGVVTITVTGVNDAPVANNDSFSTPAGQPLTILPPGILNNDVDADGNPLTVVTPIAIGPNNGTVSVGANGTFTYTPNAGFTSGTDSFSYFVSDGTVNSASPALVFITIQANTAPVVNNDGPYTVAEDELLTVAAGQGVLGNDTDAQNNTLTAIRIDQPANGTLTLNANGSFTYRPAANFNGTDSFTYIANDGQANSAATATVLISVTAVNDAPAANGDSYVAFEDQSLTIGVAIGVLSNDNDPDAGATLTAVLAALPANGSLSMNANGSFTYTPRADFFGTDSFTYRANDGVTNSNNVAVVLISVTAQNDAPRVAADSYTVAEDSTLSIAARGLLINDVDDDGDSLTATAVGTAANGAVTVSGDGSFIYIPNPNFSGTDSFVYRASDGSLNSTALVTITVTAVNDAPTAVGNTYTTNEDTPLSVTAPGLLGNDTDLDGDSLAAIVVAGPAPTQGSLALAADGGFTFTPAGNFNGTATFTYRASDGQLGSETVTVTISVAAVNDPPVANDDNYAAPAFTIQEDTLFNVSVAQGVLANDTDQEGSPLLVAAVGVVTPPVNGTVTLNANGSFNYRPNANFSGVDSFTYRASDGTDDSANVGVVRITVAAVNDAPTSAGDSYSVDEDATLSISAPGLLLNDSDVDGNPITVSLPVTALPLNGLLTANADGSFTYVPNANFSGVDSFAYRATDGTATSSIAVVTISVNPINDAPRAVNDSFSVTTSSTTTVSPGVLANDTDVDSTSLSATLIIGPTAGTVSLNANGTFVFIAPTTPTPPAQPLSFTYRLSDGQLDSTATVTIRVIDNPVAPVANPDSYTIAEDTTLVADSTVAGPTARITVNDTDANGDTINAILVAGPASGTLNLNPDGSFTYLPEANFTGSVSFTYRATDGLLQSTSVAVVTISVTAVNDAPIANPDNYSILQGATLNANSTVAGPNARVTVNDSDVEGSPLSVTLGNSVSSGTLSLQSDGSFTYTPNSGFSGIDSFTYVLSDGTLSSTGTVSINVGDINDAPVAVADSFTTDEDTPLTRPAGLGLLSNDSDPENNPLTAIQVVGPNRGTLNLASNGSFTYTPSSNFSGTDSFSYQASDGQLTSNIVLVTITIRAVNDRPLAANDASVNYTVAEDGTLAIGPIQGVLANDSDAEGDPLTAALDGLPGNGTVTLNSDGSFTYRPDPNFNGLDSFTYRASDGTATSEPATVTLTVTPVNDAPVALDNTYAIDEDGVLSIPFGQGVLSNDNDLETPATLTAARISGPANGTLTLNSNGSFTYTPHGNFAGSDSFTYRASDGVSQSALATAFITVRAVNDAPAADNDGPYTVQTGQTLSVTAANGMLAGDVDVDSANLVALVQTTPSGGTFTANADGSFTFVPFAATPAGPVTFTYQVTDGALTSNMATVTINVTTIGNRPPQATNDPPTGAFTTAEDTLLTVPQGSGLLSNDTDPDGDALNAIIVTPPPAATGTLALNANGSFTFSPAANFSGQVSFTYRANDGTLSSNTAVVRISVSPVNDPIVAVNDSGAAYTVAEDSTLSVAVADSILANDLDPDGPSPTAAQLGQPGHGTVSLSSNGTFVYTPSANYSGPDSFTYTASDGQFTSTGTVFLNVTSVNDRPTAVADTYTLSEDSQISPSIGQGVLANDIDADGPSATAELVTGPARADSFTLNANGSFLYVPNGNFAGADSFVYRVSDGQFTSTGTVTLSVTQVNDPPVAIVDRYTAQGGTTLTVTTPGLIGNDNDPDGQSLTASLVTSAAHGTAVVQTNGSFTYTPTVNYSGPDSFTYRVSDGTATSTATVFITVQPGVNTAPTAVNDGYTTDEDEGLIVPGPQGLLANDPDAQLDSLQVAPGSVVAPPSNQGTLTVNGDGSFTFIPAPNFNSGNPPLNVVSFTYRATDGSLTSNTATVLITITSINDAPLATPDTYGVTPGTDLTRNAAQGVRANDVDNDGDSLTITLLDDVTSGTLSLNADGSFTYSPNAGFEGRDSFRYSVSDGQSEDTAVVTLNVLDVLLAVGNDDAFTTSEDIALSTGNVMDNDENADSVVLVDGPSEAEGTLTFNADGTFNFVPAANFFGVASFTYNPVNSAGDGNLATARITVTPVNDEPTMTLAGNQGANDDETSGKIVNGMVTSITPGPANESTQSVTLPPVIDNDRPDLFSIQPAIDANGRLTFTPAPNVEGVATITVRITDDGGTDNGGDNTHEQTFTITIAKPFRWYNTRNPLDVNDSRGATPVTALDALNIFNRLNANVGGGNIPVPPTAPIGQPFFYDTSRDNFVSAIDALRVINELNRLAAGGPEGEGAAFAEESQSDSYFNDLGTASLSPMSASSNDEPAAAQPQETSDHNLDDIIAALAADAAEQSTRRRRLQ